MRRRQSLHGLLALGLYVASPRVAGEPGQRDSPARVATLDDAPEAVRAQLWAVFRKRLTELGYAEGRNLRIETRFAGGKLKLLDSLAAELAALKPDVIVAVTTTAALAAQRATREIPIVALGPADPVKSGLVASLARPGGNLTGASPNQAELAGKWLQLVRELVSGAKSVAYMTDPGNPGEMLVFRELEGHARPLGMSASVLDGVTSASVARAFAEIAARRTDAVIVATTTSLLAHRERIVQEAARLRVPAIYARREYAEAGGLLSYGSDVGAVFRRGADYVDRILRGARPADLPFEMASSFSFVLNLETARALGIAIPDAVRIRADEVIER
jgi:putative tryptophan/tyrosine transport system substrate-binding protein